MWDFDGRKTDPGTTSVPRYVFYIDGVTLFVISNSTFRVLYGR